MFSVVIPVYNGARFVDGAIRCVREQTFKEWEIIIINDGSTDNTQEVLEKYNSCPDITVYTQKNGGVSAARNKGIELAKFPYIALLDVDDLWRENHLEVLNEMIVKYPDAGMYCTFAETHLVDGGVIKECNYFKNHPETVYLEDFFEAYAEDKSVKMYNTVSTCITKEAAKKAGYYPVGCKIGEDLELSLKISAYYPVVLTSRRTAIYQKANSTATKDTSFDPEWHFFESVKDLYDAEDIEDSKKENIKKVMQWFMIRRSRHYMIDGNRKKAVKALKEVGKTDLKKDVLLTKILLMMPAGLVKFVFRLRWRVKA